MYTGYKTQLIYLDEAFVFVGPQLLSERVVRMECRHRGDGGPARFVVGDHIIPATVSSLSHHDLAGLTCLEHDKVQIQQVEHILSALYGMSALDTDIYLAWEDGGTVDTPIAPPVAQLSSREFSLAVASTFVAHRDQRPTRTTLDKAYVFSEVPEEASNNDPACAVFAPLHRLHVTAHTNFPTFLKTQVFSLDVTPLEYMKEVCWARSFFRTPYPHTGEWDTLRGKYPGVLRERENHYRSIMLDYDDDGWITPPLVNTEPVRHKLLDFVGELALLGVLINACIHVYKPSHRFNRDCMMRLSHELQLDQHEKG